MDNFTYEVVQRKRLARNARHKKNGSKSKKCTLPSDYLTQSQKNKMNGSVVSVYMNEPMRYGEFKKLSNRTKKEYIQFLKTEYNITQSALRDMLGCSSSTLDRQLKSLDCDFGFGVGKKMTKQQRARFQDFITGGLIMLQEDVEAAESSPASAVAVDVEEPSVVFHDAPVVNESEDTSTAPPVTMVHYEVEYGYGVDPIRIYNDLRYMTGDAGIMRVKVVVDLQS